ncbi:acylphosphatase [Allofustis seminis]|uniref:acylphosphatase n=1 Tax=Allofustis seminis TaxID=166939 RepID=UPI000366A0A9|nr:acylphosphatase [Allofustis seminis]
MKNYFQDLLNATESTQSLKKIFFTNEYSKKNPLLKIKATIYGRVQGVGFRYTTVILAEQLKVNGIVKNLPDGSVYVEACADQKSIEKFLRGLANGPSPAAEVEKVEVTYDNAIPDYSSFKTVY